MQISVYFIYDSQDNFKIIDTPGFIVAPDGSYAPITDAYFVPLEETETEYCSTRCVDALWCCLLLVAWLLMFVIVGDCW